MSSDTHSIIIQAAPIEDDRPSTINGYKLDWVRPTAPPDPKNSYRANHVVRLDLPAVIDLSPNCPPVYDQGQEGSCTANAWAGLVEYRDKNKTTPPVQLSVYESVLVLLGLKKKPTPPAQPFFTPSRNWIYWQERNLEGTTNSDAGAAVADGGKVVSTLGYPSEQTCPYTLQTLYAQPSAAAYTEAKLHVTPEPNSVDLTDLDVVRTALAAGRPIAFGFDVYASFENVDSAGRYVPAGRYMGGHAVLLVGIDMDNKTCKVRNSWGTQWGQDGYFLVSLDWLTSRQCSDAWTIVS